MAAPPATEIVSIPLKSGCNVHEAGTPDAKILADTMKTIVDQPGCQRAFWATRVEDPGILMMFIQWDSKKNHEDFIQSDAYGPFVQKFLALKGGDLSIFHVPLDPHPGLEALKDTKAHVTEVIMTYAPASSPQGDLDSYDKDIRTLCSAVKNQDGFKGFTGGWSIEEVDNEKAGGKARIHLTCIGWDSIDAHMKARESDEFKNTIGPVRSHSARKDGTVFHVKLIEV